MELKDYIIREIDNLPTLPVTVGKIMELANRMDTTAQDLNRVISLDPVLTARVLKLVNSAYYNLPNKITSIVKAIIMLGINTIKNLALSTAVINTLSGKEFAGISTESYWKHCLGCGVASKLIAKEIGIDVKQLEEYFIAGLLHDIGKIVFTRIVPNEFLIAIKKADEKRVPLYEMERSIIGMTHSESGKLIAGKWKFNQTLLDAIIYHHNPLEAPENTRKIACIVSIANKLCINDNIGFSGDVYKADFTDEELEIVGVDEDFLFSILDNIESYINRARIFLALSGEDG